MGNFKDKKGKTRVGAFLKGIKNVAPNVLKLAGNLTGIDALTSLGHAIKGDISMSNQDKTTALAMIEFDKAEMSEVTKRHVADMNSDSWLSKNIRPMTLGYMIIALSLLVILDSGVKGFTVGPAWIELYKVLLMLVFCFYFGGRTYEKVMRQKNK